MIGKAISHYQVLEKLGEGGMGVVWKARDTHLDRFAALKVLPADKLSDPERKRRFTQEAKSASALNHPNIITVYDIADAEGVPFIAMEYVAGKTLGQLIGRKGLPLSEALKYAIQIADALAKAHSAGIIHRDLKPTNIMVTDDGVVKVLDFGLAKLTESAGGEGGETRTLEREECTEEGTIVGTVAYMSPEQAEGKKVDARSDVFAFGSVLYEMVTGRRAFHGDSKLSTLSAILKDDPPPAGSFVADLPRDLERIIARCLRKDPERRFQTMADLKVALAELKEESESGKLTAAIVQPPARRRRVLAWSAVLAVLVVATAIAIWFGRSHIGMPESALTGVPLTTYPGGQEAPTFSPDGNQVAFCWDGEKQDNADIYVKLVGAGPPLRLTTNTAEDCQPAWSPDGRSIAFLRKLPQNRAAVILISPLGGAERTLAESSDFYSKPAWSPDGKWLVIADKNPPTGLDALFLLSLESGEKRRLTTPPGRLGGDGNPAFSPDGHTLTFVRSPSKMFEGSSYQGDIYLLRLSDGFMPIGEPKRATFDNRYTSRPTWTADGREVLFSAGSFMSGGLWRMTADGSSKPQRMASLGEGLKDPAVSRQGNRLAYMRESFDFNIWRMRVPEPVDKASPASPKGTPFIASTRLEFGPRFSPDGKRIVFVSGRSSPAGSSEIWLCDSDGSNQVQVTSMGADAADPNWSPDGERIAFYSSAKVNPAVYVIRANGGKPWSVTPDAPSWSPNWSRDGKWIYFGSNRGGEDQVWKVPAQGGKAVQVTKSGGKSGLESTDGKFLYYAKGPEPLSIWKVPVDGGPETQIIRSLASNLDFAVVDRGIYFIPAPSVRSFSIQFFSFGTGKISSVAVTEKRALFGLTISPDGLWVLYTQHDQYANELMLVENFQ